LAQIQIRSPSRFEFVPRDTEESKLLDSVDCGDAAFFSGNCHISVSEPHTFHKVSHISNKSQIFSTPYLFFAYTLAYTHTYTLTHTHTHSPSLSQTHSPSLSQTHSLTHFLSLSLSLSHWCHLCPQDALAYRLRDEGKRGRSSLCLKRCTPCAYIYIHICMHKYT